MNKTPNLLIWSLYVCFPDKNVSFYLNTILLVDDTDAMHIGIDEHKHGVPERVRFLHWHNMFSLALKSILLVNQIISKCSYIDISLVS